MMKKTILIYLLGFVFLFSSCNMPGEEKYEEVSQTNLKPSAWIDAPLNESYLPFAPVEIVVHATDQQAVLLAEISIDDIVLTTLDNPEPSSNLATMKYMWTPESTGKHIIAVRGQGADEEWSGYNYAVVYIAGETSTTTPTSEITTTPTPNPTPYAGFSNFAVSPSSVHYGSCTPNQVSVSANAVDSVGITTVTLFYRMRDENGNTTDWSNIAMNTGGNNHYSRTIDLASFNSSYSNGTLDIQLVIQNTNGELTRSDVYAQVGISSCLTPLFELEGSNLQIIPLIPTNTPIIVK